MSQAREAARLTELWDDAKRPADHQLRRRQHLGQGRAEGPADRRGACGCCGSRARAATSARMKLDGFATLYVDKLESLQGLYRGLGARGRDGRLPVRTAPSASTRARPASTRRRTASSRSAHIDHMHADAIIAIAASAERRAADARDLRRRDRLAAVAAARLRPRPEGRRDGPRRTRSSAGIVLGGHGLVTWGDSSQAVLPERRCA